MFGFPVQNDKSPFCSTLMKSSELHVDENVYIDGISEYISQQQQPLLCKPMSACVQSATGFLHYLDVSAGELVASHKTHMGRLPVLAQRPSSGVVLLGHPTGTVSMWLPSEKRAVLKLLTHNGAVRSIAVDHTDMYLFLSSIRFLIQRARYSLSTHTCI